MSSDTDAFAEWASRPFKPARAVEGMVDVPVGERVAEALEYMAAQLGEICRKLDYVGADGPATKEDLEHMRELLRKL